MFSQQQESTKAVKLNQEIAVKHPLHNRWALWFFKNDRTKTWAESLRLVTKFDTVSFDNNFFVLTLILGSIYGGANCKNFTFHQCCNFNQNVGIVFYNNICIFKNCIVKRVQVLMIPNMETVLNCVFSVLH